MGPRFSGVEESPPHMEPGKANPASTVTTRDTSENTDWIAKAAQQRFDRMYAVTSAGTRIVLT